MDGAQCVCVSVYGFNQVQKRQSIQLSIISLNFPQKWLYCGHFTSSISQWSTTIDLASASVSVRRHRRVTGTVRTSLSLVEKRIANSTQTHTTVAKSRRKQTATSGSSRAERCLPPMKLRLFHALRSASRDVVFTLVTRRRFLDVSVKI